MAAKVIATRGPGMYLIRNDDGSGQIADTERGILFPPQSVASIAARGYWEEVPEGSVDLAEILRLVRSELPLGPLRRSMGA